MENKSLDSLHDVLRRTIERKPITMHWKNDGKIGCSTPVGDAEVASMHCDAHHYLTLKDSYCSLCAEAARQALDQSTEATAGIAGQTEARLEKRLGEMVYANGFPLTIRDVKEAVRYASCAKCRGSGLLRSPRGGEGGVKYCACQLGAEQYHRDLTRTDVIVAPITREWHLFPAEQYGTPEFLRLCTDQAKEQRAAGRLAIASALERYVERELTK